MSLAPVLPSASRRLRAALALLLLPVTVTLAQAAPREGTGAVSDPRERLLRMHAAAFERNYEGTMVFSAGGAVSSSRVAHFCVGDQSYERIEALDGPPQQVLRHNDKVHTLWPQSGVMLVESRQALVPGGAMADRVDPRALEQYELRAEGRDRIAGRPAEVFLLAPRDEWRYAQRLWADVASGLMLRADVIGPGRQVLESSAFSQVEIGVRPRPELVVNALRQASRWKVVQARHVPSRLEDEGWQLAGELPGFRLTSSVRRPLDVAASPDAAGESASMLQAVFSDGLTHVSLFIERFDPARHRREVQAQMGATATLMQRRGDDWLTAMGDVPPGTLRQLLAAVQRRR